MSARREYGDSTRNEGPIKAHPRSPVRVSRPQSSDIIAEVHPILRFRTGLTLKLVIPLTVGMCVILAAHFLTTIRRERLLFEETKGQYGRLIGGALAQQFAETWDNGGNARARLLRQELGNHVSVTWIPPDRPTALNPEEPLSILQRATLERGEPITVVRRQGNREALLTYVPLPLPGKGLVAVVDAFSDRDFYVRASVMRFLVALALIVALNGLLALGLSSWLVTRPFGKLVVKARQVGSGNLSVPVKLERRDEIGELGREMDRMSQNLLQADSRVRAEEAARQKAEEELHHANRLATIGKLAAGIAHELGTPLNVISGRAKRVGRQHQDDPVTQDNISIIRNQVDRVTQIVQQLLQFARRRKIKKSRVDLGKLARSTVAEIESTCAPNVEFELIVDETTDVCAEIDGRQIQQVLTNLMINGAQAMPMGGQLTISLGSRRAGPPDGNQEANGDYLCVSVMDQGQGIAPGDLDHIFEPFFTTKDVGGGTGLGLAVSHGIVQDHGGWIDVETELGKGSRFTVYLPGWST